MQKSPSNDEPLFSKTYYLKYSHNWNIENKAPPLHILDNVKYRTIATKIIKPPTTYPVNGQFVRSLFPHLQ